MEALYEAIGAMLKDGAEFDRAYDLLNEAGSEPANTWIRLCVQCARRFDVRPEKSEFLTFWRNPAVSTLKLDEQCLTDLKLFTE